MQHETIYAADAIDQAKKIVNPNSVYVAFREGRIRGHKEGNRIIFERPSWEKWIEAALMKRLLAAKYSAIREQQPQRITKREALLVAIQRRTIDLTLVA